MMFLEIGTLIEIWILDISVSGYPYIRVFRYSDIRVSGYSGIRVTRNPDIKISG
jgi:hypothetical protein